jgi:hypothetical protein
MTAQAGKRAASRRHSFRDVLAGVAAIAALFVLLAGVPIALTAAFGLPVPHTTPSVSLLTHRLDLNAVIKVCSVVVWLAWLQLVWCVIAEVVAAVRNTGMPARVPLAGGTQALVHRLVTAALLLSSTATTLSPALMAAPAPTVASVGVRPGLAATSAGVGVGGRDADAMAAGRVADVTGAIAGATAASRAEGAVARSGVGGAVSFAAAGGVLTDSGAAVGRGAMAGGAVTNAGIRGAAGARQAGSAGDVAELLAAPAVGSGSTVFSGPGGHKTEKIYVVEPPQGRFHESLWEIAARHLGDGRRYREIFEMNAGRIQPDGTELTIASLIRPGWVLVMPHDAHGPGIRVITPGHHRHGQSGGHGGGQGQQGGGGQQGSGGQGSGGQGSGHQGSGGQGSGHQGSGGQGSGHQGSGGQGSGHQGSGGQGSGHQGGGHQRSGGHGSGQHAGGGNGQGAGAQGGGAPPAHQRAGSPPRVTAPQPGGSPVPITPAPTAPGQGRSGSGQPTPGQSASRGSSPQPAPQQSGTASFIGEHELPLGLAAAGLLAAGVLAALAARRRRQQRRRRPGKLLALPGRRAALSEAALRLGADENAAGLVDTGLRYLSQALIAQGRTPPTVFAAHVGEDNLDLWVAPASQDAPEPWFAVGDGQVWRLPLPSVLGFGIGDLDSVPAPYPGLVSIGTDATGRVLVDVASAHGLIGVSGPDDMVHDALAAMAVELATSRWSEGIRLTLVGFDPGLTALAPDRVRQVPTLAEALPELESWAAEVAEVLGPLGTGSIPVARAEGLRTADWEPHYLISAVEPAPGWERDRLLALARTGHAAGAAYVTAGDIPGASWTWEITPEGRLLAGQLGLDVAVQLIGHDQQAALGDMFEATDDMDGVPLSAPPLDLAPAEHLLPQSELPVEVTLLGPVSVRGPGEVEPGRLAIATEIVVYLATHPGGVHPNVLTAAIWPRGVTPQVRDAALERVTDWLGSDGIGRPHLASDTAGRFRLGSGVRVDWQVFRTLVARAAEAAAQPTSTGSHAAPAPGRKDEAALLEQALGLVGGPFLAGREPGRYGWLAVDGLEYEVEARVADAAHRLCQVRLAAEDPHRAMAEARTGLKIAPDDELLWRDLITAAHATREEKLLQSVVGEICGWARVDDRMPGLVPETEALIDELLPSWRWSVA